MNCTSNFVFEDQAGRERPRRFSIEFKTAAIDMLPGAQTYPFYGSGSSDGRLPPVSKVSISSKGLSGPTQYGIGDRPGASLSKIMDNTFRLTRLERVEIFQAWLVVMRGIPFLPQYSAVALLGQKLASAAKGGRNATVLATTEPFYAVFWADFDLRVRDRDGDPTYTWGLYGGQGYDPGLGVLRRIQNFGQSPSPKLVLGDGGRSPVLNGQIAAVRGNLALMQNGLANVGT